MSVSLDARTAVLVDFHPLWLNSVRDVVGRLGVSVVGAATTPSKGLKLVEEVRPDLVVTGLKTPDGDIDAFTFIRRARETVPGVKVIVLSMYDDHEHIDSAFEAGAVAYVLKTAHPDDLAAAVRQAFEHSIFLAGARPATVPLQRSDELPGLTRRELEILQLVSEGYSNGQLAKMLWVTEQTVKFHLSNIYRKLNVANRTEASRWAQLNGLLAERMAREIA